jgi:hypothetical protein
MWTILRNKSLRKWNLLRNVLWCSHISKCIPLIDHNNYRSVKVFQLVNLTKSKLSKFKIKSREDLKLAAITNRSIKETMSKIRYRNKCTDNCSWKQLIIVKLLLLKLITKEALAGHQTKISLIWMQSKDKVQLQKTKIWQMESVTSDRMMELFSL